MRENVLGFDMTELPHTTHVSDVRTDTAADERKQWSQQAGGLGLALKPAPAIWLVG